MNVDDIFQLQRDDAFAQQFSAEEYNTFVAMPFTNKGGYPAERIKKILGNIHSQANSKKQTQRNFLPLHRSDDGASGSIVITDQIIRDILSCHFFVGDLTGSNFGVIIESGIALALKPNRRVILLSQDPPPHFDVSVTRIVPYTEETLETKLTSELLSAATYFEEEADKYIRFLSGQITPDAHALLNLYGRFWKDWKAGDAHPCLHEPICEKANPERFSGNSGKVSFHNAIRELNDRRLCWTHYKPNAEPGKDHYGIHATALGWKVIELIWKHDPQMRKPAAAPTGPNMV